MEEITKQTKKENGFVRVLKAVFVRNWDLKLAAIAVGFFCWILGVIAL